MCVIWTVYYACNCNEAAKISSGCDGNCTKQNIRYDNSRDVELSENCSQYIAVRQFQTPPTSSDDFSASETSEE
jgi:hypothetical protein